MSSPPLIGLSGEITPNEEALWRMIASLRRNVFKIGGADLLSDQALITDPTQLADAVVTNAKIANLSVDTARVRDLTVTTIKVVGNAITTGLEFTNTAGVSFSTTEVQIGSITITTQGGPVLVIAKCTIQRGGTPANVFNCSLILRRDGVQIDISTETDDGGGRLADFTALRLDSAPAGSHTYTMFAVADQQINTVSQRVMSAIELKR